VITLDEFVERLCRLGSDRGPRAFPRKRRDRTILFQSIRLWLNSERRYTESEINDALRAWLREVAPAISTDHVTIRRLLVDYGHLDRTPDGAVYQVGFPREMDVFELEVYDVDVRATCAAFRDDQARRARSAREAARHSGVPD